MNFYDLCKMTALQSGTIQNFPPTLAAATSLRLKQIIEFVNEAYIDIQNAHRMWKWMNSRFVGNTIAGQREYLATSFKDERQNVAITRFSQWGFRQDGSDTGLSMYLTATGPAEEGSLRWLDVDYFYETQARGPQTPGKPQAYTVGLDNRLLFSPIPDKVYTIRGKYRKSPQYLTDDPPGTATMDSNVPEMPIDFHTIIKDAALCYVEGFDEGPRIPVYRLRMLPNFSMLESFQLPKVQWGAPLA